MEAIIRHLEKLCGRIESSKDSNDFFSNLEQYINYMADVPAVRKLVEDESKETLFNEYQRFKSLVEVNKQGASDLPDYSKNRYLRGITHKISAPSKNSHSVADDAWFWEHVGFPNQCKKIVKFNDALIAELVKIEDEKPVRAGAGLAPVEQAESKVKAKSPRAEVEWIKIKTIDLDKNKRLLIINDGNPLVQFNKRKGGNDTKTFKILSKLWLSHCEIGRLQSISSTHWSSMSEIQKDYDVRSEGALERLIYLLNGRFLDARLDIEITTKGGLCRLVVNFH